MANKATRTDHWVWWLLYALIYYGGGFVVIYLLAKYPWLMLLSI